LQEEDISIAELANILQTWIAVKNVNSENIAQWFDVE
jgi:hypothetical protein